jgi:hypothetical protein
VPVGGFVPLAATKRLSTSWSWQEFAGKEATLDGDGRTFGELNALRMVA